ncbi:beta strand repeat-containing protein [Roseovarius ramblicola]|uniref:Beta strand repeat-containing protein n=1 Tax=Roseovarius ramblicola TaxID=2022336 RepID=A0ABV5HXM4_9RHOB
MTLKNNLLGTAAAVAVSTAFGAAVVHAQATAVTNVGPTQNMTLTGDVVGDNTQLVTANPTATTTGSTVTINMINLGAAPDTLTGALSGTDNLFSASATGNSGSTSAILAFAPSTLGDTAVVGNLQSVETDTISATASGDTHSILIENPNASVRTFTGTALLDNNDTTASATGNSGTSAINIDPGVNVAEEAAGQASADIDATLAGSPDNDASGDLVVSSSQEIESTPAATTINITGTVTSADTTATIEDLASGTVTVSDSDQASTATGNAASNSIASNGTTASITGSAVVSNLQSIDPIEAVIITADTIDSTVSASAGDDSNGNLSGAVLDSTITVSGNAQSSDATGNDSTQTIALDASNITGEPGGAATSSDSDTVTGGVQLNAEGDAVIANVQREADGTTVRGRTTNNSITGFSETTTDTSTIAVDGNSQTASATGATTSNSLSLTSGADQSAAGVVASVQNAGAGAGVQASATGNSTTVTTPLAVTDSSLLNTGNDIGSTATGGDATNDLSVTNGTNNLSAGTNSGGTNINTGGTGDQPTVTAAQVVTNDQSRAGGVSATSTDNQVATVFGSDNSAGSTTGSTIVTDGNSLSASATGQTADNGISLAFNALNGTLSGTGTGTVASVANEQDMTDTSTVTARNVGTDGNPILTEQTGFAPDVLDSSLSTSDNTVSVIARGNVTTGNDVSADGTNITSGSAASPFVTTGGSVSAGGSFVSASSQVSGATILATQNSDETGSAFSNTIETGVANSLSDSTLVSDDNLLSSSATANTAANSVSLGGAASATIGASGTVANYQGTTGQGSVTATLGVVGQDPTAGFNSNNSGQSNQGFLEQFGDDIVNSDANPVVVTFGTPLTTEEQAILAAAGFDNATVGDTTAEIPGNGTVDTSQLAIIFQSNASGNPGQFGSDNGDEVLQINGFFTPPSQGSFNGAGVIARIDADGAGFGQISGSTVSVSDNTVVGEATGNTATNAASAEATSVTGPAADASTDPSDADVAPADAELATANVQVNGSALQTDVAATFGIIDDGDDIEPTLNSSQTLDSNLQQSFATANRATNSVDVTATNSDAATALESSQLSNATVDTTSDVQVLANVGSTNSSLDMTNNRNESVANGNVVTNSVDASATNLDAGTGADATVDVGNVSAGNVLASRQNVTASISADADTDVFNQDETATGDPIISGSVEQSGNVTIAQATGNQTTPASNSLTLDGSANNDRTGALANVQTATGSGTITATVDQSVRVELDQTATVPVQQSSIVQDGNVTSALARSNVATNSVTVDGANINGGAGGDATFDVTTDTLTGAHVLASSQDNQFGVSATTNQSQVRLSSTNSDGNAIDGSSVSQSGNSSLATALANSAVNTLSSGSGAANVNASTQLGNTQTNIGAVAATGSSSVGVVAAANAATVTDATGINLSSVDVSGNVSSASAVGNQAQNTLGATGANILSGDQGASGPSATNATVDASGFAGDVNANAGNLLLSNQANAGTISSANNSNIVTIDASAATGTGAAASGSTLSVGGNAVEARATANLALNNSVNVGDMATATTGATGIVGNFQFNDTTGAVTASASTTTSVTLNGAGTAGALANGTADVSGNSVLALARGNVSQNVLNAEGSNVGTGSTNATTTSVLPDSGVLNASFGVFNEQVQQASVNASSTGASFRVNATSTTGQALNGASASLSGNSVQASGFGNVATNSVTLTALNGTGNDATAAIFNGQTNSGNITSTATGASIGVFSTGLVTASSAAVGGNSIGSTAVGNFSSSTVTRANR